MLDRKILACYTNPFLEVVNELGAEHKTFITPELTKNGRLNFNVDVRDKPNKLFYVTYNIQSGVFNVHVSKVMGLDLPKCHKAVETLTVLTDCIEVLNDEIELIREIVDLKNGG